MLNNLKEGGTSHPNQFITSSK